MNNPFKAKKQRLFQLEMLRKGTGKQAAKPVAPAEPVYEKCPECDAMNLVAELEGNLYVCPSCGHHETVGAAKRIRQVMDRGAGVKELNGRLISPNVLDFPGYDGKLSEARKKSGLSEAIVTVRGKIGGIPSVVGVMDSSFMMGSMGAAVGEKVARAFEYAARAKLPVVLFCASGGARMQEGIVSLMQMAKTSAAVERFSRAGGLFISVLTHPTTGGVTASFASLGDIILAEPGALIGFAGPRVIEQTIGQTLPDGFQRAEYLQEHGFVDRIVPRGEMRETIALLLRLHERGQGG